MVPLLSSDVGLECSLHHDWTRSKRHQVCIWWLPTSYIRVWNVMLPYFYERCSWHVATYILCLRNNFINYHVLFNLLSLTSSTLAVSGQMNAGMCNGFLFTLNCSGRAHHEDSSSELPVADPKSNPSHFCSHFLLLLPTSNWVLAVRRSFRQLRCEASGEIRMSFVLTMELECRNQFGTLHPSSD